MGASFWMDVEATMLTLVAVAVFGSDASFIEGKFGSDAVDVLVEACSQTFFGIGVFEGAVAFGSILFPVFIMGGATGVIVDCMVFPWVSDIQ
jgi:hypothetical protein